MSVNMLDPWNRTPPYGSRKEVTGNCKVMGGALEEGCGVVGFALRQPHTCLVHTWPLLEREVPQLASRDLSSPPV